jgi:hypothetical protein
VKKQIQIRAQKEVWIRTFAIQQITQQREDKNYGTLLQAVEGSGAPVYYMKGALEGVLVKCDSYLQHGSVRPLANTAVPATVVRHAAELGKGGEAATTLRSGRYHTDNQCCGSGSVLI